MRFGHCIKLYVLVLTFSVLACVGQGLAVADQPKDLASALTPLASALSGRMPQFEITGHAH